MTDIELLDHAEYYAAARGHGLKFREYYEQFRQRQGIRRSAEAALVQLYGQAVVDKLG